MGWVKAIVVAVVVAAVVVVRSCPAEGQAGGCVTPSCQDRAVLWGLLRAEKLVSMMCVCVWMLCVNVARECCTWMLCVCVCVCVCVFANLKWGQVQLQQRLWGRRWGCHQRHPDGWEKYWLANENYESSSKRAKERGGKKKEKKNSPMCLEH